MLLRLATVSLVKPRKLPTVSSFSQTRQFSHRIIVKQPLGTNIIQLRHLSLSGNRFNASLEASADVLEKVLADVAKEAVVADVTKEAVVADVTKEAVVADVAKEAVVADVAKEAVVAETSNSAPEATNELVFEIPEKPEVVDAVVDVKADIFELPEKPQPLDISEIVGEPSFESLGLASWWPSGRMQYLMENFHIGLELEWWQTIVVSTVLMRLLMFPVVVLAQKNMANMANNSPKMAVIQEKMTDARRRGDMLESAQLGQELQMFMKKKGINPLKNAVPILFQAPVFMSFFFALRGMAYCPVESLTTGGLLWFEDLTVKDPFWALPVLTSATLYTQLRLGAEGARLDQMGPKMKMAMTVLPFCMLPLTVNFPMAVTFYWATTNIISLIQAQVLKIKTLRKALKIPELIIHKESTPGKKKGFVQGFRESMDNLKTQQSVIDRRAYDDQQFRDAGVKKPLKTFKYDPTKPVALKRKS